MAKSKPDSKTKPHPPFLRLLFSSDTDDKIKNSLVPRHLNTGTEKLRYRLMVYKPNENGEYPPIIIGRGQYSNQDDEHLLKVDTTSSSMSSKQLEFSVIMKHDGEIESLQLLNMGKNPVDIKQRGHDRRKLYNGEAVTVHDEDRLFLLDEKDTCFKIGHDLRVSTTVFGVCLEEVSRDVRC